MDKNNSQSIDIEITKVKFICIQLAELITVIFTTYQLFPAFLGIAVSIAFLGLNIFTYHKYKLNKINIKNAVIFGTVSIVISFVVHRLLDDAMTVNVLNYDLAKKVMLFIFLMITFIQLLILISLFYKALKGYGELKKKFLEQLLYSMPLPFMFFISVPIEYMVSNQDDYAFNIIDYLKMNLLPAIVVVFIITIVGAFLTDKDRILYNDFFIGITIASYVQYMFMNRGMGEIDGHSFRIDEDIRLVVINVLIWIAILVLSFLFNKHIKIKRNIIIAIMALQFVALVTNVATNTNKLTGYNKHFFDYSESFRVGPKDNIIILCFDSVDNSFIKTLLEEDYDFSEFSDFNMFTNTCSVYDKTFNSLPQMLTASQPDEDNEDCNVFYERLINNGYDINFFNYCSYSPEFKLRKFIHNYINIPKDVELKPIIGYQSFFNYSAKLMAYSFSPYLIKNYINISDVDFYTNVRVDVNMGQKSYYGNKSHYENLNLEISGDTENYFAFKLLNGAHVPSEDFVEDTKFCLEIAKKYINQLKELGLYDNATILLTADHGIHDGFQGVEFPTPATPMFMIKRKGEHHDVMQMTDAPEYHTDILATLLESAGLYKDSDQQYIGKSVFSYGEDEKRTRIWYNESFGEMHKYVYEGNTADLEYIVENDLYDKDWEEWSQSFDK